MGKRLVLIIWWLGDVLCVNGGVGVGFEGRGAGSEGGRVGGGLSVSFVGGFGWGGIVVKEGGG